MGPLPGERCIQCRICQLQNAGLQLGQRVLGVCSAGYNIWRAWMESHCGLHPKFFRHYPLGWTTEFCD